MGDTNKKCHEFLEPYEPNLGHKETNTKSEWAYFQVN